MITQVNYKITNSFIWARDTGLQYMIHRISDQCIFKRITNRIIDSNETLCSTRQQQCSTVPAQVMQTVPDWSHYNIGWWHDFFSFFCCIHIAILHKIFLYFYAQFVFIDTNFLRHCIHVLNMLSLKLLHGIIWSAYKLITIQYISSAVPFIAFFIHYSLFYV